MNLKPLCDNFKLNLKFIEPLTYMTLNGQTIIYNYAELEDLEYGLVNLAHAINLYKQSEFNDKHCNVLQDVI
jgi:hypothetical protein